MNIIQVSKTRIQNICKKRWIKGEPLKENRGGDTRSRHSVGKCNAVDTLMISLKTLEAHYCRGKSKRQNLPNDLSINKLWRIYNSNRENPELKTKNLFSGTMSTKNVTLGLVNLQFMCVLFVCSFQKKLNLRKLNMKKHL